MNPNILRRMLSKYAENGCMTRENFSQAMNDEHCLDVGGTVKDLDEVYNMLIEKGSLQNSEEASLCGKVYRYDMCLKRKGIQVFLHRA